MVRRTLWIVPLFLVVLVLARGGYAQRETQGPRTRIETPGPMTGVSDSRPLPTPHRTEAEEALFAIQEEGKNRVKELAARIRNAATSEEALSLQKEVVEVKRETRLRLLREHMDQAIAAGDPSRVQEVQAQIELMTNPHRSQLPAVHRDPPASTGN